MKHTRLKIQLKKIRDDETAKATLEFLRLGHDVVIMQERGWLKSK